MSDTPPEKRPVETRGVALFLTLGMLAGFGSCLFVTMYVEQGAGLARDFNRELAGLAKFYISVSGAAYAVPAFTWLVAMVVTKAGRKQKNLGSMLAILLFAFSIVWAAGALLAFMDSYNPPRDLAPQTMP